MWIKGVWYFRSSCSCCSNFCVKVVWRFLQVSLRFLPTWLTKSINREPNVTVSGRSSSWMAITGKRAILYSLWYQRIKSMHSPHIHLTLMKVLDVIACVGFRCSSRLTSFVLDRKWPLLWHNRPSTSDCSRWSFTRCQHTSYESNCQHVSEAVRQSCPPRLNTHLTGIENPA